MMGTGISSLSTLPNTFTETEETPQMKIVLVGVPNSGKTAFFTSIIDPGIGLYRRHMRNKKMRDHFEAFTSFGEIHQICGHDFPIDIVDPATYLPSTTMVSPHYVRGAHGVLLISDTTTERVIWENEIKFQLRLLDEFCPAGLTPPPIVVIVGSKSDSRKRKLYYEEARQASKAFYLPYIESSARYHENVAESLHYLILRILFQHPLFIESKKKISFEKMELICRGTFSPDSILADVCLDIVYLIYLYLAKLDGLIIPFVKNYDSN